MQERNKMAAIWLVLLLVPFAVFFPTLDAGFLNWDDDVNVFENPGVHGVTADNLAWMFSDFGHAIRYKPLSWLGWAVVYEAFGLNPFGYHLANVVVHCLNTLLLFFFLGHLVRLAIGNGDSAGHNGVSTLACVGGALFWALHPMRVEPVAWVTGFPYGTSLFLLLVSTILYLRSQDPEKPESGRRWDYWASVAIYALSAITYPIVLGFLAVLVAVDFFPLRRFESEGRLSLWSLGARQAWFAKLPYFLIALSLVALTLYGRFRHTEYWIQPATMDEFGLGARIMQGAYVWAYYVWKPLLPIDLCPVYTTLIWNDPLDAEFFGSLILVVGVSVLLLIKWRKWPMLLAVWVAHLGILVPMLGLTERPHYAHDRYGIINGMFWSVVLVGVVVRYRANEAFRNRSILFIGFLLLACGYWSVRYQRVWRNDVAFFTHMAARQGANEYRNLALLNLGEAMVAEGNDGDAVVRFAEAAETEDVLWVFPFDFQRLALSHGNALLNLSRWSEAAAQFRKALAINPDNVAARNNLAIALWKDGNLSGAIIELREVVRRQPGRGDSHFNLGTILLAADQPAEAIMVLREARRLGVDEATVSGKLMEAAQLAAGKQ
jgi:protein O-mannosyl-transferase